MDIGILLHLKITGRGGCLADIEKFGRIKFRNLGNIRKTILTNPRPVKASVIEKMFNVTGSSVSSVERGENPQIRSMLSYLTAYGFKPSFLITQHKESFMRSTLSKVIARYLNAFDPQTEQPRKIGTHKIFHAYPDTFWNTKKDSLLLGNWQAGNEAVLPNNNLTFADLVKKVEEFNGAITDRAGITNFNKYNNKQHDNSTFYLSTLLDLVARCEHELYLVLKWEMPLDAFYAWEALKLTTQTGTSIIDENHMLIDELAIGTDAKAKVNNFEVNPVVCRFMNQVFEPIMKIISSDTAPWSAPSNHNEIESVLLKYRQQEGCDKVPTSPNSDT